MQHITNLIVDHDPMTVLRRTTDTVRYIRWAWNKDHAEPIDEEVLLVYRSTISSLTHCSLIRSNK